MKRSRTPLVLVAGLSRSRTHAAATALLDASVGTVAVHADLGDVGSGVVVRTVREHRPGGVTEARTAVELAHGCLSCTLRLDLLPLLRDLARRDGVTRIVVQLDPALDPEHLCWAVDAVVLDDEPAGPPETAGDSVEVAAVVAVVDRETWLADVAGDDGLADRGLGGEPDDERGVAQVLVGQAAFADVVLLAGDAPDAWADARLTAVLDRLAPGAPRGELADADPDLLIAELAPGARRGRPTTAHDPLLAGEPPLTEDAGVQLVPFSAQRPFSPGRLHDALDVLLDGVVTGRGRIWLASQPDQVIWLESAGGGLRVAAAGPWLATLGDDPDAWADVDPERRAAAGLRWHPLHGDRATELVVLTAGQPADRITAALTAALLTDAELAGGPDAWLRLPDPFGAWHEDPCEATGPRDDAGLQTGNREEQSE